MHLPIEVEADQRPIPAPHRAVVETHVTELAGRIVAQRRNQNEMLALILLEDLEQRLANVAGAEAHAREIAVGDIDGLLEQGYARFVPERMAEKKRRIGACSDHRSRSDDRRVEVTDGTLGFTLQMNLERRGSGLEHHVVMSGIELGFTFDMDDQRLAVA